MGWSRVDLSTMQKERVTFLLVRKDNSKLAKGKFELAIGKMACCQGGTILLLY